MKNIFKKFLFIFLILSIFLSVSIVSNAENVSEIDPINLARDNNQLSSSTNEDKNLFSASSEDITIDTDVTGDAFIFTSEKVVINSTISGNVFICATNVEIAENASIKSSLFVVSENLNILGNISGNVYALSQSCTISPTAHIVLDMFLMSENSIIYGNIDGDANIACQNITISEDAYIGQNLAYSSEAEIVVPNNVVFGNIYYANNADSSEEIPQNSTSDFIFPIITYITVTLILFLICQKLNCNFINKHQNFTKNILKYLLYGILGLIVTPFVSIILLVFGYTMPLAFVLLLLYFIFMLIASTSIIINIALLLDEKLKEKIKINDIVRQILFIIVLCIAYKLLVQIPTIGFIITLLFNVAGFGLLFKSMLKEKEEN